MSDKVTAHTERSSWYANYFNDAIRLIGLLLLIAAAGAVYKYLFADIITGKSHFFAYVALWLFTAYIILPWVYRTFSRIYLPNYFFGRTQTGDGLLGDPVNLAFNGTREQIMVAMERAGWSLAEDLNTRSTFRMIYAAVRGAKYSNAPVSSLFLFGRKQEFAFEKDVDGNPRRRHHIRFWKTPDNWWLPGGYKTDWLAAATFDRNVGLSLFTGQITHKIDANVDKERDFVIDSLKHTHLIKGINIVKHFTSSYHSRNGGGDMIHTDGALPFITIA